MVHSNWLRSFSGLSRQLSRRDRRPLASRRRQRGGDSSAVAAAQHLEDRTLLATFVVDTTNDTVDASPGDGIAEDASGDTSLRAAIMEANALAGADSITIPAGSYTLTISGIDENSAATGDLDILDDLTITGDGAGLTIIDANSIDRVLQVHSGTNTDPVELTLTGVAITGGEVNGGPGPDEDRGGGLFIDFDAKATLSSVLFHDNAAPRIDLATNFGFGFGGAILTRGDLTILDSRFENNLGTNAGGAIGVQGSDASTFILRTTFANNVGDSGGAMLARGDVTIEESLFVGNSDRGPTNGNGGALNIQIGGMTQVTNSTFTGNTSDVGGAIRLFGTATINASTITNNSASLGGGVYAGFAEPGNLSIENSIIAGNTATTGPDVRGTIVSAGHNLVGNTASSSGFGATGDLLNVNPMLGPLADNSGPTLTHELLPGSPALDAANTATAPATDQRGIPRPQNGDADIGAFEFADLLTITIDMASISENGGTTTGTVTRNTTQGRRVITLTSSDETEATVTATVTLNNGQASGTFTITGVDDTVADGTQIVTLTASADDFVDGTATIEVADDETAALTLSIDMASISEGGGAATGTVTRNTPTTGDLVVTLASSDETEATVPAMVTILDGQNSATFPVNGANDAIVDGTQTVTITASAGGFLDGTDTIDITDDDTPALTLSIDTSAINENGGSATGTVTRNTPTTGDLVVTLNSSDESEATVPAMVTIPVGQDSATFAITAADDPIADGTQTVTITASAAGFADGTEIIDITDNERASITLSIDPTEISENGGAATGTVTRNTPTTDDLVVTLTSFDETEAIVPATVTISAGQDSATFEITAVDDAIADGTKSVTIIASADLGADGFVSYDTSFGGTGILALPADYSNTVVNIDVAIQPDGKILTSLLHPTDSNRWRLMRYTPGGSLDPTFSGDGIVDTIWFETVRPSTVQVLPDGRIFVHGENSLARYNSDGSLDGTFGAGGRVTHSSFMTTTSVAPDGRIYGTSVFGNTLRLWRFLENGTLDTTFGDGGSTDIEVSTTGINAAREILFDSFGRIVLVGFAGFDVLTTNANYDMTAIRVLTDGTLDSTFGTGGFTRIDFTPDDFGTAAVMLPDGKIAILGGTGSFGEDNWGVSRLNPDGSLDTSFSDDGKTIVPLSGMGASALAIAAQDDGKLVLGGGHRTTSWPTYAFARYDVDGSLDSTFHVGGLRTFPARHFDHPEQVYGMALQADGKIVAVGGGSSTGGSDWDIMRLDFAGPVVTVSDAIDVTDDEVALLTLPIDQSAINENGGMATGTVTRNTPVSDALVVTLSSSDTTEATVPAMVTIPPGQQSATFAITAVDDAIVDGTQTATITAAAGGFDDATDTIDILDDDTATLALSIDPSVVLEGNTTTGTVTRNTPISADLVVTLASSNENRATVPAMVTIPAGQNLATFVITTIDDDIADGTQTVSITATAGGFVDGAADVSIRDNDSAELALTIEPTTISENGGTATGTVTRNTPTTDELVVQLTSSDTTEASVPATVTIPAGMNSATFPITARNDPIGDGTQTVTITAIASGLANGVAALDVTDDDDAGPVTLTVDTLVDESDGDFSAGDLSLREAIELANENVGADTILFDTGLSGGTITLGGTQLRITDDVTITGLGASELTIDGNDVSRIFHVEAEPPGPLDVEIHDLTLTRGSANQGGAIFNDGGNVSVASSVITASRAGTGGGIASVDGSLFVTDSSIAGNRVGIAGGGIFNDAASQMTVAGSVVSGNSISDNVSGGGGIWNAGTMTVVGSTISANSSFERGGGVYNAQTGNLTVIRSTLTANDTSSQGGGLFNLTGIVTVWESTVSGNTAVNAGGGGIANNGGQMTVVNSTLSGNSAARFGGGIISQLENGELTVINSTLSDNTAGISGGGISAFFGTATVINSTIVLNRAGAEGDETAVGGGVHARDFTTLHNTIVAGNLRGAPGSDLSDDLGDVNFDAASSHNLIGDAATAGGLTDGVNGNVVGNSGAGTIPIGTILNTTLANNGGPTLTHALVGGSPAIDNGDTTEALDENGIPLQTDQRIFNRIAGASVDIGAVEFGSVPVYLPTIVEAVLNGGSANRSGIAGMVLTFSDAVTIASVSSLNLFNHTTGMRVSLSGATLVNNGTTTITLDLSDLDAPLPDGHYSLELPKNETAPTLFATYTTSFWKQSGDIDGDGAVNFNDTVPISFHFGVTGAEPYTDGDANGDGAVNFNDTVPLSLNFGTSLDAVTYDFGDATENDTFYSTTLDHNGARHVITGNTLLLGSNRDAESDGQPSANANGDDTSGNADEDGVDISESVVRGTSVGVTVTSTGAGFVNAWIDFNQDGDWDDPGEHVLIDEPVIADMNNLEMTIPVEALLGDAFARFRLTGTAGYSHFGLAPDGEVEDYLVNIVDPVEDLVADPGPDIANSAPDDAGPVPGDADPETVDAAETIHITTTDDPPQERSGDRRQDHLTRILSPQFTTFDHPLSQFFKNSRSRGRGR